MGGEIDTVGDFSPSGEAAGGAAGEGEVGVGSEKVSGLRQLFEEESFFGAVGAAEGEERVTSLINQGVNPEQIILDPGIGFAKVS